MDFFYDAEAFVPARFRAYFEHPPDTPDLTVDWDDQALRFSYADAAGEDAFVVGLIRNLAILHEFVNQVLGTYQAPGADLLKDQPGGQSVAIVVSDVTKRVNAFLKEHLPSEQLFEKGPSHSQLSDKPAQLRRQGRTTG